MTFILSLLRSPFFLVLAFGFMALVIFLKAKLSSLENAREWPFYARKPLSSPEQVLYFRLCKTLPDHIVLAQVGLSRILGVKKGHSYQAWFNRISQKSVDFVICATDSSILAVIELDDSTHERASRKVADETKDKALSSAGIRVIRWQVKSMPDEQAIREEFYLGEVKRLTAET